MLKELQWLETALEDENVTSNEWNERGNALINEATKLQPALFKQFDEAFKAFQNRENDINLTIWLKKELKENTPILLEEDARTETYRVGEIKITVPKILKGMNFKLYDAVNRRRDADLTGVCSCSETGKIKNGSYVIEHTTDCVANDENLKKNLQDFWLKEKI